MSQVRWKRMGRLAWNFARFALVLFVLAMLPDLFRFIPEGARALWFEALALLCVIAYAIARRLDAPGAESGRLPDRARRILAWIDSRTDWAFEKGLIIVLGGECLLLLLAWVPHYLTWPFSRDEDTFAVLAMSWDHGILPYRDIRAYNFPGETYLFWALGKVFGWGRTVPFYIVDASCVLSLGAMLLFWSRKRLGGILPGIIAYLAFLRFYLNQAFEITGERDWHTAFLVTIGILMLQAVPGRWSRVFSALTTAMALTVRPHAVLFLPAELAALSEQEDPSGPGWRGRVRNALKWCLWLGLFTAIGFAPLVLAGIADDLIRGLRVASYGGPYNKATPKDAVLVFLDQFLVWRLDVPLAVTLLLAAIPRHKLTRMARTWAIAWLGALIYRPLHPVHHLYLIHPILVVASITWAFAAYCLVSTQRLPRQVIIFATMILAYEILPAWPFMCGLTDSAYAIRDLALGKMPERSPLGCIKPFPRFMHHPVGRTSWENYCDLLDYLKKTTSPHTMIANVLHLYPYEALNGPTGRLSPFMAESGVCWMTWVDIDLDPEFAASLEKAEDSVAVWYPDQVSYEPRMRYERVREVIRKYYEPEAKFKQIEVWRRKPAPHGP